MIKFPLLVTSSISAVASRTSLINSQERLLQTLNALDYWIRSAPHMPIVFCDGSGYDISRHVQQFIDKGSNIEVMAFMNDRQSISDFGKGWGEAKIIEYALKNSTIINNSTGFFKCTARLWVTNHQRFENNACSDFQFDYYGRILPSRVDTRYYFARVGVFKDILSSAFTEIDENIGRDLETVYAKRLRASCGTKDYISVVVPLVSGISGSMGTKYYPSKSRSTVKEIRNRLVRLLDV